MSYISLTYHIVFATYRRMPSIVIEHERELYKYIHDFSRERGIHVWRIGGMPDHVHLLCNIPSTIAPSRFVQSLKAETSKFLRVNPHFHLWEKWGEGVCIITKSRGDVDTVINYIKGQKEHHRRIPFQDELREFLKENGIQDEGYTLGDDIPR